MNVIFYTNVLQLWTFTPLNNIGKKCVSFIYCIIYVLLYYLMKLKYGGI